MSSVLTAQQTSRTTSFVLSYSLTSTNTTTRWPAFLMHDTAQFFIKAPGSLPLCKASLLMVLELAEELGVAEVFMCVPKHGRNTDELVTEFASLAFTVLSPRTQPMEEFVVLRFDF